MAIDKPVLFDFCDILTLRAEIKKRAWKVLFRSLLCQIWHCVISGRFLYESFTSFFRKQRTHQSLYTIVS
ncbi:hypothetical protein Y032_0015g2548 [Ancylostoma ceylanicum]|uniref:Uncharacterized protein n=1 Tax=Ancylostoma ceylanicum TaxID=53326 RepID=A0A016V7J3_9BILA|nr:hypothetical protein Y032_0015g2548 [Ancylostoma ceylanicum]